MADAVRIKKGRANPLWHGHPWVYSGAIERVEGGPQPGGLVSVLDERGQLIGRGFFNSHSQIRVRMLTFRDEPVDDGFIARRIGEAVALRRRLGMPAADTNTYRLINSEGDGLPGLTVDVYDNALAVQFTTLGMKKREAQVFSALEETGATTIVEIGSARFAELEGFTSETRVVRGTLADGQLARVRENGILYDVDLLHGQKTGMFLDQRENRRRIQSLASGARMLDVYSYAGGFALNALKGGAAHVTCVDSSARAIERILAHAALNQLGPLEAVEADAFRFLETAIPEHHDLVVLDPPKFARERKDLEAALKGYRRLNTLGMVTTKKGGFLATCSCSQLVSAEDFERMLAGAAKDSGRRCQVLSLGSQGDDHPLLPGFVEGRYLKFVLCQIR